MNHYFVVTAASTAEIEVVKSVKPPRILISYFYFRNRNLIEFIKEIGYQPEILLDSGAYSAFNKKKNIAPVDYMDWIDANKDFINNYIALDVIGKPNTTKNYYNLMKSEGFKPMPVYHYGASLEYLEWYISQGETYIALGNTVPINDKGKVAEWINYLIIKYPGIKFHLLGSSSEVVQSVKGLESADSSSWILMALNGSPKVIPGKSREAKIKRAMANMKMELTKTMESKSIQIILFP
jgi:hypothetical protein